MASARYVGFVSATTLLNREMEASEFRPNVGPFHLIAERHQGISGSWRRQTLPRVTLKVEAVKSGKWSHLWLWADMELQNHVQAARDYKIVFLVCARFALSSLNANQLASR
ncbi:hypothetical protein CCHR01_15432 [Colletotrichum chrysophilum]|uniref:Uncharacterized protein n=1 Tax=Colletotrichum chrysophilum TaxID=1836956 RepID=A0AAD9A6C5_9PEZI|nr:hypothetical protein CCHR01_15432 [Colletotrichum chrysophilum]